MENIQKQIQNKIQIRKVERLSTAKLLQLTKSLSEQDQYDLLSYIGRLETSEDKMVSRVERLFYELQ